MVKLFLLVAVALTGFAAFDRTDAQYCTPATSPYSATNLASYSLINQATTPIVLTTSALVDTAQQAVKDYIVKKHNCLRTLPSPAAANMLAIQWNAEAAANAQQHANNCVYQHNANLNRTTSQFGCGQNIAMVGGSTPMSWKIAMDLWWNEVNDCTDGTCASSTPGAVIGHYTQMAWAKTWQVGCGWANCPSTSTSMNFYVCNYCPAGNYNGESTYQTGTSCSACPNNCSQGKLCTNPCPYTDAISNCNTTALPLSYSCDTIRSSCMATCNCGGKNGLNQNAGPATTVAPATATTTQAPTTTTAAPNTTTTRAPTTATVAATTTTIRAPTGVTTTAPTTTVPSSGKPNGYNACNPAFCSGKANNYYQVWPCSNLLCGCSSGVATLYGCGTGTYFDGSTGSCKAANSSWCAAKTPTSTPTPAAWPAVPSTLAAMCNANNCVGRFGTSFNYFTLNSCGAYWCYCASATSQSVQTCPAGQFFDYRPEAPACAASNTLPYC